MNHCLDATPDDVATALDRLGLNGYKDDLADRWFERLDMEEALCAADAAHGDMDEQTDALISNLEAQLRDAGVPGKTLEAIEAEEAAAELDKTLEGSCPSGSRPRM